MSSGLILKSSLAQIEDYFIVKTMSREGLDHPILVTTGNTSPIITQQNPDILTLSNFGMTPSWAKHPMQLIHARAEGDKNPENDPSFLGSKAIFLKKAFRKPLFSQRCIVLADAFIQWSSDSDHQPYLFYLRNQVHPFGIAGLYDQWKEPGSELTLHSFCIITVPANTLVRKIHGSRMPVILSPGKEKRWLKPANTLSDILGMLVKYPSERMNAYPVSKKIDSFPTDRSILLPVGDKLLSEATPQPLPRQNYYGHKKK